MLKRLGCILFLFICIGLMKLSAQASNPPDTSSTQTKASANKTETLDTNESIKYMSSSLWFQMKKRLNLTTEEEEKKEAENKKKKRVLTIAGIKIES